MTEFDVLWIMVMCLIVLRFEQIRSIGSGVKADTARYFGGRRCAGSREGRHMADIGRIARMQNEERSLVLLRAIGVTQRYAQRAQEASLVVSVLVAALGLILRPVPGTTSTAVIVGTAWAVLYATLVVPLAGRSMRTSAILQEMFDTTVLALPWNKVLVGDPVPEDDISRLSRRDRRDEDSLRDYYLVAGVPAPYDVLFCMEQNLAWGSRVRRRFTNAVAILAAVWFVVGLMTAIGTDSTVGRMVTQWLVPSLGMLLLCADIVRAQVSITRERTRVLALVRTAVEVKAPSVPANDPAFARQVQDVLFQLRRQQPRAPGWFFRRFRDDDMTDFRYKMRELETRFGDATQPKP
jgi:hypothetical protein